MDDAVAVAGEGVAGAALGFLMETALRRGGIFRQRREFR
jgi:hypothetical protein